MDTDELIAPTRSREELIREQGWPEDRVARDFKWRRTGFPEEQVDRRLVAFMAALYGLTFGEGPPWYIFEPGELAIALSLTDAENHRARASAIEGIVDDQARVGTFSPEQVAATKPVVRRMRADAVMYERRARLALPSRRPIRQHSRGGTRRRIRSSRCRVRAPVGSDSEPEPPLAAAHAETRVNA